MKRLPLEPLRSGRQWLTAGQLWYIQWVIKNMGVIQLKKSIHLFGLIMLAGLVLLSACSSVEEKPSATSTAETTASNYTVVEDKKFDNTEQKQVRVVTNEPNYEVVTKAVMNEFKNQNLDSMQLFIHAAASDGEAYGELKAHAFIAYTSKGVGQVGAEKPNTYKIMVAKTSTEEVTEQTVH
ncbi:hypothetical protein FHS18_003713 [Paenibacillus phyllosphaerae]|uniref:Uncharacterized protein n=1 Tax=Paenibacillus phyllosphaerae TaxID=274593 RepID=A0A7W5AZI0_9BACL|nr:hypothetical protein [Paenibacillus phyllosphaerae]MBB3111645.1 hypothetical protein [Paenibacillus phyllosphaerae]